MYLNLLEVTLFSRPMRRVTFLHFCLMDAINIFNLREYRRTSIYKVASARSL